MTSRILGAALGAAIALFVASPGLADESHTGRIVAVDAAAGTFTIQADTGDRIEYGLRGDASIRMNDDRGDASIRMNDDRGAQLNELRAGQRVTVTSSEEGTGRVAHQVRVLGAEGAERPGMAPAADTHPDDADRFPDRLPQTASLLPLLAALGAASLVTGGMLRWRRRR